jgi:multisubunit Na+/H+ antiporter MnhB subunit
MSDDKASALRRLSHIALLLLVTLIFVGLALAVVALPPVAVGLSDEVNAQLARTGIHSSVTATLLNFRGYDTLLEIAVLLLAVTAIRALVRGDLPTMQPVDEILALFSRILVPFMILIAGYLLMAGLDASGGAFQAGTILAAAGVLLILAGRRVPLPDEGPLIRLGLAIGLAAFIAVGVACMLVADAFLDYPQHSATYIALLLEVGVSVAVALSLLEMFVGVLRGSAMGTTTHATKKEER